MSSLTDVSTPNLQASIKTGSAHATEVAMEYMNMQTTMYATQYRIEEARDDLISKRKVWKIKKNNSLFGKN